MKKETKNYDIKSILRWVALLPALAITWYAVAMAAAAIDGWLFKQYSFLALIIILMILPSIAMFFVARFIVPKYKNTSGIFAGILAVVLCALWVVFLFYGLGHMAY